MRLLPSPFPDTNLNLVDLGAQINLKIVHGWDFNLMAATPVGEQASHCTTLAPIYIVQTGNTHIPIWGWWQLVLISELLKSI